MQKIIGIVLLAVGIYLCMNDSVFFGVALLIFGAGVANGADHGVWICFHTGDGDGCDSDGGGD